MGLENISEQTIEDCRPNFKVHEQSESRGEHVDKRVRGGGGAPLKGGGGCCLWARTQPPSL